MSDNQIDLAFVQEPYNIRNNLAEYLNHLELMWVEMQENDKRFL